jgi:hypothetical protein
MGMPVLPPLDFDAYHCGVLPARCVSDLARVAARDVRGVPAIAFRLHDGRAYRLAPAGDVIAVEAGCDAPIVLELEEAAWSDFVHELATGAGLLYAGRVRFARGTAADLERWEPALRALYNGRPLLDPCRIELCDADGTPLDLRRRFSLADPPAALARFLEQAGFAHVRGVFAPSEVAALRRVVERHQAAARPGDGTSWWARRRDGADVLCRLIYLGLRAPEVAALSDDARLRALAALGAEPLLPALDRSDGHSVVLKNPDVVAGLSDLPWHRDCGLGGHPVTCPVLNVGIQLDAANAASGRLLFVPGTAGGSVHRSALAQPDVPVAAIDTEPGDVTIHCGCVLHAAPPPLGTGPGRRTLYFTFMPARAYDAIGPQQSYNDVIRAQHGGVPSAPPPDAS